MRLMNAFVFSFSLLSLFHLAVDCAQVFHFGFFGPLKYLPILKRSIEDVNSQLFADGNAINATLVLPSVCDENYVRTTVTPFFNDKGLLGIFGPSFKINNGLFSKTFWDRLLSSSIWIFLWWQQASIAVICSNIAHFPKSDAVSVVFSALSCG